MCGFTNIRHMLPCLLQHNFFQLGSSRSAQRRRSGRIARKVLGEKVNFANSHAASTQNHVTSNDTFSHSTVASCGQTAGINGSTMETYQEFEVSISSYIGKIFKKKKQT